jgi:TPR repeat protein
LDYDPNTAKTIWKFLAERGYGPAGLRMGKAMIQDYKDVEAAKAYWELAADSGFANAYVNIAKLYAEGTLVKENRALAGDYLEKAVKKDDKEAKFLYSLYLEAENKNGDKEVGELAQKHLVDAAKKGKFTQHH